MKRIMCAPADAPITTPGSSFDNVCVLCGVKVMMAPTGQAFVAANPDAEIVCFNCVFKDPEGNVAVGFAGDVKDVIGEFDRACPNPRGSRN